MNSPVDMHYQAWGKGPPVLALHGLGVESTMFTGLARGISAMGLRLLAADLPGFGKTPAPDKRLTPAVLAEPVIELAGRLESPPLVMGLSLGGRVALEAALRAPERFRGVVMIAPPLPPRKIPWTRNLSRLLSPEIARRIPLEKAWPWLKKQADRLEAELAQSAEHDWFGRASKRAIYYFSCPATRWAFVSAIRELGLDPADGPDGVWSRMGGLRIPAAFVWGDQDRFVPMDNIPHIAELLPGAYEVHVPCAGHHDNGPHFECLEHGGLQAVRMVHFSAGDPRQAVKDRNVSVPCNVLAALPAPSAA